jgi:hypothetical protein
MMEPVRANSPSRDLDKTKNVVRKPRRSVLSKMRISQDSSFLYGRDSRDSKFCEDWTESIDHYPRNTRSRVLNPTKKR